MVISSIHIRKQWTYRISTITLRGAFVVNGTVQQKVPVISAWHVGADPYEYLAAMTTAALKFLEAQAGERLL